MQLHVGSCRNHNAALFERFGPDMGADIPVQTEWTRNLHALLNAYGNDPRFRLILFTLDESTYSRELAPLAGHYPAVLLGPAAVSSPPHPASTMAAPINKPVQLECTKLRM